MSKNLIFFHFSWQFAEYTVSDEMVCQSIASIIYFIMLTYHVHTSLSHSIMQMIIKLNCKEQCTVAPEIKIAKQQYIVILTKPNKIVHAECTSYNMSAFALFNVIKENNDKKMYFSHMLQIFLIAIIIGHVATGWCVILIFLVLSNELLHQVLKISPTDQHPKPTTLWLKYFCDIKSNKQFIAWRKEKVDVSMKD